ncbi:LVIVD repeat-containing protein [Flagellimonas alvinocaridis]|uniref:LVIVD repeat-containing protein n=1 Tax=Flagellimonas alvinocaridis TaxID=2530200 RepID=UPI003C7D080B
MKKKILFLVSLTLLFFVACDDDESNGEYAEYLVARPIVMSQAEFAASVDIIAPRPIDESGKIYTYKDYIFVNDKHQGIHVINNANPQQPVKIGFIKIPGNVDISIKDDFLYADSLMDLVVLDISDINNIKQVNRLENVLYSNVFWPMEADIFEYEDYDYQTEILIGWETITERRLISEVEEGIGRGFFFDNVAVAEAANDGGSGQGGSLARFKIVADYLYAVDNHNINIFNISDLDNPKELEDVYAGFDIETIFNRDNHLFLGSMRGMYIYDITNPAKPEFVSEFEHGTACDPIVVDGNYAYVTLRGGNWCGATESGLFIVDISNIESPELAISYPMDGPYGLGIKGEKLFVCDGDSGLKVYDKTDINDLKQLNHFEDIVTFDVIPLENQLIMVGDEVLYQYEYLDDGIKLISQIGLK